MKEFEIKDNDKGKNIASWKKKSKLAATSSLISQPCVAN